MAVADYYAMRPDVIAAYIEAHLSIGEARGRQLDVRNGAFKRLNSEHGFFWEGRDTVSRHPAGGPEYMKRYAEIDATYYRQVGEHDAINAKLRLNLSLSESLS